VAHLRERAMVVNKPSTRLDQTWTRYTGLAFSCGCCRNCGSLVRSAITIIRGWMITESEQYLYSHETEFK